MTTSQETVAAPAVPQWQVDLDRVGFVRRLLMARKWYGGDWWFVLISACLLAFVVVVESRLSGSPPMIPGQRSAPHCWRPAKSR